MIDLAGERAHVLFRSGPLQSVGPAREVGLHARLLEAQVVGLRGCKQLVAVVYAVLALLNGVGRRGQKRAVLVQLVPRKPSDLFVLLYFAHVYM